MTDGIITSAWDLVNELWGNAPYGNVWVKHRGSSTSTWFAISGEAQGVAGALPLSRFNAETARLAQRVGADVYFGVHPVSAIPPGPGARTQAAIVHSARCLFADYDRKDYAGIESNEALAEMIGQRTVPTTPSVMVDTGGGIHAYWLLEHREDLTDAGARAEHAALQDRWVRAVGADDGAKDLARVLRLPGTLNQKYTPAPTVKIIDGNGIRYSLDVLRRMAAATPTIIDLGRAQRVAATTATTPAEDRTDGHADAPQTALDAPRRADTPKPTTTAATPAAPLLGADERPGDYYKANHGPDALVLLLETGWVIDREDADGALYLTRPGKDDGVSASWGKVAPSVLYVFSSNAHPFEAGRSYDAFGVFALLAHNGNHAEAARAIRQTMMPAPPSAPTRQGAPIARDAGGRPLEARIVPGHTPAPRFRAMTVAELIAAGADQIPWIVPHLIAPRVITVIAGKGQSGKSLLMLRVAIEIAQHYPVLWYALEAAGEIAGRAAVIESELRNKRKLGIDTRHLGIVSTQYEGGSVVNEPLDVTKPASIEAWGHWIREQGFRVVVIDAWVNLLGNAGLDENSTADASRAVAALDQIMTIADCAVVVIAHSAKAPNGMGDAVRGSSVLTNSARVVIAMSNDDGDVTARTVKANNQKPFNEIRFDITSVEHDGRSGPMIDRRVQGRPALTTITPKHLRVLQTIGALDAGEGVTIKDISDALQADMSRQVATPIVNALGDWGYLAVEKKPSGKGSVYRLSTQGRAVVDAAEAGADVAAHTIQNPALAHKNAPTIFTVTPATARQFDGPMGEHADEIDDLATYSAPMLGPVAATTATTPAEDRTDGRADDAAQTAPEALRRAEAPKPTTTAAAPAAPIPSMPAAPDDADADLFEATTPAAPAAPDRSAPSSPTATTAADRSAGSAPAPDEEAPMTPTTEARPVAPDTMMPALAPAQLAWHEEGAATIVEYWWRRHATEARTAAAARDRIITIRRGRTPSGREQYLVCDNSCFGLLRGTWLWGYATEDRARAAARALGFTPSPIVSAIAVETAEWYAPVP